MRYKGICDWLKIMITYIYGPKGNSLFIKIKEFVEWEILKEYFNAVMDPIVDL